MKCLSSPLHCRSQPGSSSRPHPPVSWSYMAEEVRRYLLTKNSRSVVKWLNQSIKYMLNITCGPVTSQGHGAASSALCLSITFIELMHKHRQYCHHQYPCNTIILMITVLLIIILIFEIITIINNIINTVISLFIIVFIISIFTINFMVIGVLIILIMITS